MSSSCLQWPCGHPAPSSCFPVGIPLSRVVTPSLGFSRGMLPSPLMGNSIFILLYAGHRHSEAFIDGVCPCPSSNEEEEGFVVDVGSLHASPPLKVDSTV